MMHHKMIPATIAAALLLAACPLFTVDARPVKVSTFHYYRDIDLPSGTRAAYGRLILDEAVALHAFGYDLRLALDGQPIPYFARVRETGGGAKGIVNVIHQERTENTSIYVIQVAGAPAGMMPVDLEVTSDSNFESGARVQSGSRPGEWRESGHVSVYQYDQQPGRIRLSDAGPYYRLEFDSKRAYAFPSVRFAPVRTAEEFKIVPGADWKQDYDSDARATVFYYANPSHRKLSRITLQFKEERYRRNISFLQFDRASKSYSPFFSTVLFRKDGNAVQSVDFRDTTSEPLKIVITDGDDQPLHLEEALFYGQVEELIFQMPEHDALKPDSKLRLYYGNKYTTAPDYDLERSFEKTLPMTAAALGPETKNEAFAYSAMEPPVSSWIIRILFLAGLAAMALPAWKILSRYAERVRSV
ncbi:MAG: hypothetical protein HY042_10950 [Spirochaetia bacterium]|nr:hypothetical protein [Spirochaetia bacterium]